MLDVTLYNNDPTKRKKLIDKTLNCASHYDPGLFALSFLSTAKGLELLDPSTDIWVKGPLSSHAESKIGVIWLGEAAHAASGGRLPRGIHRVSMGKKQRLTMWMEINTSDQVPKESNAATKDTVLMLKNVNVSSPAKKTRKSSKNKKTKKTKKLAVAQKKDETVQDTLLHAEELSGVPMTKADVSYGDTSEELSKSDGSHISEKDLAAFGENAESAKKKSMKSKKLTVAQESPPKIRKGFFSTLKDRIFLRHPPDLEDLYGVPTTKALYIDPGDTYS
eukprot:TRINITY_DN22055_c0_g1_i2.p1 TRINITY_DN22055_c0_g1~~TRINITY_DN22055_c0_g1_i2.p1  ORF type:complete len:277 (-),score=63.99 TRINITY_DN22055_c0_g1_i2:302-1132(-)